MSSEIGRWCATHRGLLIVLVPAVLLTFYFLSPFLSGIIMGTLFAYIGRPIRDIFKERRRLGSAVAVVCIIVPVSIILGLGALELINLAIWLAGHQELVSLTLGKFIDSLNIPPTAYDLAGGSLQNVAELVTAFLSGLPVLEIGRSASLFALNFIIAMPVCYFLLLDGEEVMESTTAFIPPDKAEVYRRYFARVDRTLSGIFLGSIYTAIIGGLISAVIFSIFDLPRPFAFAAMVFMATIVPILNALVVILPLGAYIYLAMGPGEAVLFLITASTTIYIPSELFIRPLLVSAKSSIHPLLVMLSFFGGMLVAGIGGFFLAPAIVGVLVALYQVRLEEIEACRQRERESQG